MAVSQGVFPKPAAGFGTRAIEESMIAMIGDFRWSFSQAGCWVVAGFGMIANQEKRDRHDWRVPLNFSQPVVKRNLQESRLVGLSQAERGLWSAAGSTPLGVVKPRSRQHPNTVGLGPIFMTAGAKISDQFSSALARWAA